MKRTTNRKWTATLYSKENYIVIC